MAPKKEGSAAGAEALALPGEKMHLEAIAKKFQLAYRLENNIFTIKGLTGHTAGGEIKTNMEVDLNDPDLSYKGNVAVNSVAMDQL